MLRVPAYLTRLSTTQDGSLSLGFNTQEMGLAQQMEAFSYHRKFGHLVFSANAISDSDIPKTPARDNRKTPSQRQRNTLFVLWKQTQPANSDFEAYYSSRMEKIIDQLKSELDNGEAE